jgi:acyl carrier protein
MDMSDELLGIFREVFCKTDLEINDDMTANELAGWDSLRHIKLINAVEQKFAIRFKNSELARIKCIADLRAVIKTHMDGKNA